MSFYSIYDQGFARVAACTVPAALADPATNAERILAEVRLCHDDGVAVALFPELSLSGYAIDDLLMQTFRYQRGGRTAGFLARNSNVTASDLKAFRMSL